ncbi:hypothetical protein, partial [Phyllobacterium chamaecytisi]|uniref:hypothetical protein n=1 Tax=Phyllobacterium chamaecytisi TaxID=2876082 RepID=UPI001CC92431
HSRCRIAPREKRISLIANARIVVLFPSGAVLLQVRPALGALQPKLIDKVKSSFPGVAPRHMPVRFPPPSWTFSLHKATGSFQEF